MAGEVKHGDDIAGAIVSRARYDSWNNLTRELWGRVSEQNFGHFPEFAESIINPGEDQQILIGHCVSKRIKFVAGWNVDPYAYKSDLVPIIGGGEVPSSDCLYLFHLAAGRIAGMSIISERTAMRLSIRLPRADCFWQKDSEQNLDQEYFEYLVPTLSAWDGILEQFVYRLGRLFPGDWENLSAVDYCAGPPVILQNFPIDVYHSQLKDYLKNTEPPERRRALCKALVYTIRQKLASMWGGESFIAAYARAIILDESDPEGLREASLRAIVSD